MPLYTFSCPSCGWKGDQRTGFDTNNVHCPQCPWLAERESVYSINFGGFARTPSEERDWSHDFKNYREANAEIDYRKGRLEEGMQKRIPDPPLFKAGEARARELIRKGAKDANDLS